MLGDTDRRTGLHLSEKHDAEYQRLQNKILELTERYPVIETFMESNQAISLTTEEHKAVHQYFRLESERK